MTAIEITLLILILLLLFGLKYHGQLLQLVQNLVRTNEQQRRWFWQILREIARLLRLARRFSLVYLCKNRFYRLYLAMAIAVVSLKVGMALSPDLEQMSPIWMERGLNFLLVSAAWEIICLIIKTIDDHLAEP